MYLLAQFRESQAYLPIVEFFSVPGDLSMDVTGDLVTEDLGRILASVCDGKIEPIQQLIENRQANEYMRSSALSSLIILVIQGAFQQKHFWHRGFKPITSENSNAKQKEISGEDAKTSTSKKSIEEKIRNEKVTRKHGKIVNQLG